MTVWAKLQSWLGASASDVAIDNEFNNIYLGLNEAANGSLPNGYNDVRLNYLTDQLTAKGDTKVNGLNVVLNSTITVSGATGWRYVCSTSGGVVSVETIPAIEIAANTTQYTPIPVFDEALNGYYSSTNPTKRIIGIIYYHTTNKIEFAKPYKNGKDKNDDLWFGTNGTGTLSAVNERLQFSDPLTYSRGDGITIVDNGYGTDDTFGVCVTNNENKPLTIDLTFLINIVAVGYAGIAVNKNGTLFDSQIVSLAGATGTTATIPYHFVDNDSQATDHYTFYISSIGGTAQVRILSIKAGR